MKLIEKEILLELYAEEILFLFVRSVKMFDDDALSRAKKAVLEESAIRDAHKEL